MTDIDIMPVARFNGNGTLSAQNRAEHLIDGATLMAASAYRGDSDAALRLAFEVGVLRSDVRTLCQQLGDVPALVKNAALTPEQAVEILEALHERFPGNDIDSAAGCLRDEITDMRSPEQIAEDAAELRSEIDNDDQRWAA